MTHDVSPHGPDGSADGWVALVGGGPGSSGLITARGLELLGRAVTGGFAKPAAWLLEGLFAEETSAVQMLIPAFTPWKNILRVVLLYGAGMVAVLWPRNTIRRMEDFRPTLWRGAALTVLTLWCVLSFTGVTTFIYSNF